MNKSELISAMAAEGGLSKADSKRALDAFIASVTKALKAGDKGEFYQFNLSSCIRQQNSLTAQFVSFSLSNLANIFYPPQFLQ